MKLITDEMLTDKVPSIINQPIRRLASSFVSETIKISILRDL